MGLDMFLYAIPKHAKIDSLDEFSKYCNEAELHSMDNDHDGFIVAAQWRKANAVHGWFTEHCKCLEPEVLYEVTQKDILNLIETCTQVLLSKNKKEMAEKYLPPTKGCFYGSYEIDGYYDYHLLRVIGDLGKVLADDHDLKKINGEYVSVNYNKYYYYAYW